VTPRALQLSGIRKRFGGVTAVEGSGRRELLHALTGRAQPSDGELRLPDEIGLIPRDRQQDALLLGESVADNFALRNAGRRRGWFHRDAGMAVVYYKADLDELTEIADRVVVMFEGRVREVARERDAVGRAMLGAA